MCDGAIDGVIVRAKLGHADGSVDGSIDGLRELNSLRLVGATVGTLEGAFLGAMLGAKLGNANDGSIEG